MKNPWVTPEDLGVSSNSPFAYEACQTASFLLWALSGRRYQGPTTVTEVYEYPPLESSWPYRPVLDAGEVYNVAGLTAYGLNTYGYGGFNTLYTGAIGIGCGCGSMDHAHLRLRGRPVRSITSVRLPGDETDLDPESYWLENRAVLASSSCRSLCGASITYTYGLAAPVAGRRAARYLAKQLVLSWEGSEDCELPETVTSVTRQGVQYQLLDQGTLIDDMRTGIYAVDLFLKAVNPDNARRAARVFSPDVPKAKRIARHTPTPSEVGPYDLQIVPGQPYTWTVSLDEVGGGLLDGLNYVPRGQISTWNGATAYEYDASHFTVGSNGIMTCRLEAEDTQRARLIGQGNWDLYAVQATDPNTFIHLITSNVWLTSHSALQSV